METIYLVIVVLLFILAASDLVVGVSNDAVNFLNSAVGAKVASYKVIMVIAAFGVLVGALFSSGMMEVARKGIFNPGQFYFSEIMIIFMAVMVTDVLLLDLYNTFGLPTSTTVSIVFELLGAAVGIASIKVFFSDSGQMVSDFINSSKALAIISGILVSVVIAFTVGAVIQYLTRMAFSFNFKKRIKYIGGIWGGMAFTALTYFMLIKGAKGASFMSDDVKDWISHNSLLIIFYSFIGWTVILQLLYWLFRINILKIIVLVGTFSLAMAFAGNDLVNFIGVPIAGFNSWEFWTASGSAPDNLLMNALGGKVPTPGIFLVAAGVIMVITLYTSKKAKSVLRTSIDLSRQDEGDERFRPTWFSQVMVRYSIKASEFMNKIIPNRILNTIEKQFTPAESDETEKDPPAFDLIRASVNLTVASVLIAFGTSLKLPLSTTYVTFMVAMGTSLADNAWGRESAVYRISGVISVIGGWFLTAISAFSAALIMAYLFYFGDVYAMVIVIGFVGYLIFKSYKRHQRTESEHVKETQDIQDISKDNIAERSVSNITSNIKAINEALADVIKGLTEEDKKIIKATQKNMRVVTANTKYMKDHINIIVEKLKGENIETAYNFVQVLDFMREALHSINFIIKPALLHIENHHKPLTEAQIKELNHLLEMINSISNKVITAIDTENYKSQNIIETSVAELNNVITRYNKNQIKRIKNAETGTKASMLYLGILNELKHLGFNILNVYKAQRDFDRK